MIRFAFLFLFLLLASSVLAQGVVNVYSARQEALIKPLFDEFTKETGIKVNILSAKAEALIERLRLEGSRSPADVLLTVDAGNLYTAKVDGLFQILPASVRSLAPAAMQDTEGAWVALSLRARPIFASKSRVDASKVMNYEDLADPALKGQVCVRSSGNIYNQSMIAAMMEQIGAEATAAWAKGLVANFARPPVGGDRDQIKAVAAGECDFALANTYYYVGMLNSDKADEKAAAEKVFIIWPNQDNRGTHINVSGAGILKSAKNTENAEKLLTFLLSPKAQAWYAEQNGEYPVIEDATLSDVLVSLGTFKKEQVDWNVLGKNNAEAVKLMDRAGWK
jgi:iron(III) transport system substrate-binding protein